MTPSPRIAIVTTSDTDVFQQTVIAGARPVLTAAGCTVRVDVVPYGTAWYEPNGADALLVIADVLPDLALEAMLMLGVRLVLVGHHVPTLPIPAVTCSNTAGMTQLLQHVVETCGRRRLVYLRGLPGQQDAVEREHALLDTVLRCNLPAPVLLRGDFQPETAAESLAAYCDTAGAALPFDAAIGADYLMAAAALNVLINRGIRVPEHVAVAGFGDGEMAALAQITTVSINVREQGQRAARLLLAQWHGAAITGRTLLNTTLVVRATT